MKRDLKELIQELLDHIDENPLTDEQIEKSKNGLRIGIITVVTANLAINHIKC